MSIDQVVGIIWFVLNTCGPRFAKQVFKNVMLSFFLTQEEKKWILAFNLFLSGFTNRFFCHLKVKTLKDCLIDSRPGMHIIIFHHIFHCMLYPYNILQVQIQPPHWTKYFVNGWLMKRFYAKWYNCEIHNVNVMLMQHCTKYSFVWHHTAVADPRGAQQVCPPPPLKLDQLCFFNPIFLSEFLKIRLRLHERALKRP